MFVFRFKPSLSTAITIEELNFLKVSKFFNGDIMSVYSTFLDKMQRTQQILSVDLTKNASMMVITLTIAADII